MKKRITLLATMIILALPATVLAEKKLETKASAEGVEGIPFGTSYAEVMETLVTNDMEEGKDYAYKDNELFLLLNQEYGGMTVNKLYYFNEDAELDSAMYQTKIKEYEEYSKFMADYYDMREAVKKEYGEPDEDTYLGEVKTLNIEDEVMAGEIRMASIWNYDDGSEIMLASDAGQSKGIGELGIFVHFSAGTEFATETSVTEFAGFKMNTSFLNIKNKVITNDMKEDEDYRITDDEKSIFLYDQDFDDTAVDVQYTFDDDYSLDGGIYFLTNQDCKNTDEYISDYYDFIEIIRKRYGEPTSDNIVSNDNEKKDNINNALENAEARISTVWEFDDGSKIVASMQKLEPDRNFISTVCFYR